MQQLVWVLWRNHRCWALVWCGVPTHTSYYTCLYVSNKSYLTHMTCPNFGRLKHSQHTHKSQTSAGRHVHYTVNCNVREYYIARLFILIIWCVLYLIYIFSKPSCVHEQKVSVSATQAQTHTHINTIITILGITFHYCPVTNCCVCTLQLQDNPLLCI